MNHVNLADKRRFLEDKLQKVALFDSSKMFVDQYCLLPGQAQKVHSHAQEDKVYVVLEGEALFEVGGESELLSEGMAVIAEAGVPHGVRNDSATPVVLLVVMAPKPQR